MAEFDPSKTGDGNVKPDEGEEVFSGVRQNADGEQVIHDPLMGETLAVNAEGEVEGTISDR